MRYGDVSEQGDGTECGGGSWTLVTDPMTVAGWSVVGEIKKLNKPHIKYTTLTESISTWVIKTFWFF